MFLLGYPGDLGGANTEAWHTIKLWRRLGLDVHLIPTWGCDPRWQQRVDALGCHTHQVCASQLEQVPGLAGSPVVGMCNSEFMVHAPRLRRLGCPLVWVNCMTFLFAHETDFFAAAGPAEAMIYQSEFQRSQLEPQLARFGYDPATGHTIRGAFDWTEWDFNPRPHPPGEPFVIGRAARPDVDKWSSNTWPIYERIQYRHKRALMLGMNDATHAKLGPAPPWADCLKPLALQPQTFFAALHCTLPINGGARENWPRAGLEAMATGVPIVAQGEWGWKEMIEQGETGFLGSCDEELAHYAAVLAYDEPLRMRIARQARERLVEELAAPEQCSRAWLQVFEAVSGRQRAVA
ncbi:glycosyltransferase [Anatilimnocola sp. NA78]|uniref:glycosyltransferase n=1 Tax=Anatilimnocola sp. NA78 TaxID=3415683 RepID=UPI003CE4BF98